MSVNVEQCFERILKDQQKAVGPCKGCPLRGPSPAYGMGDWDSQIALVAMSPNEKRKSKEAYEPERTDLSEFRREMIRNWDNVDTSQPGGRWDFAPLLDRILKVISTRLENVYFTNVTKCALSEDKKKPNIKDQKRDLDGFKQCWNHLEAELQDVRPRLVVTFGQHAASAVHRICGWRDGLMPLPSIKELHGETRSSDSRKMTVLHLIHWSNSHMNMNKVCRDKGMKFEDSASKRLLTAAKEAGLL